ncbi:hypothetical protein D9756_000352 [Leucocoprinus leucothites]|uniref:Long chronological lifespan protein 2 n=1 Tax=Leucocoprinus leucothites TaxID=201217 RepID=A0A8H5GFN3_9AGAR|nr:hypothetical protein D9756_000352 [Leucoagaricus leucothites]
MSRHYLCSTYSALLLAFICLLQIHVSMAQFEGFFNMFNGGQQQQHQQQQQQHRSSSSQFSAYVDSVSCARYLCPLTLDCVENPSECPCPNAEDIKCLIPDMDGDVDDGTVICVRGKQECEEVERLMQKYSDRRRK